MIKILKLFAKNIFPKNQLFVMPNSKMMTHMISPEKES